MTDAPKKSPMPANLSLSTMTEREYRIDTKPSIITRSYDEAGLSTPMHSIDIKDTSLDTMQKQLFFLAQILKVATTTLAPIVETVCPDEKYGGLRYELDHLRQRLYDLHAALSKEEPDWYTQPALPF